MAAGRRIQTVRVLTGNLFSLLALMGCSGEMGKGHDPSSTDTTGMPVPSDNTGNPTPGGAKVPSGPPPMATCGGAALPALPVAYTANCSACHTQAGSANGRYPDLYQFKGTLADFTKHVREGSPKGMAAYTADLVSDADIQAIFTYFTSGQMRQSLDIISLGGVAPLFQPSDAVNPPIVFKRDDGVLITRGAGRVRGRHEGPLDTNQPFMEFVADYFLSRTYGWIVEDYTTTGQSRIRVTYLPISMPTGGTNFRAWKDYGNGDVFTNNGGMK